MSKKYQLMIDPTPSGWAYGFPRALPEEAVGGTGYDLWIKNDFDLAKWVVEQGYPEEHFQYYKVFPKEIDNYDPDVHGGGIEDFTTQYVYPGSDCQE